MPGSLDNEHISEWFNNYRQFMYKIAFGILNNKPDAEDAVQDAFMRVMNDLEKVSKIPKNERVFYFASVIKNVSVNYLNMKKRHPSDDIDEHYELASDYSVEKKADEKFLISEIKSALKALPKRDYSIIYFLFFDGMSPKEIANALDIPQKNIHKYIERAKKRFVTFLNERGIYYDL